jgi:BMFP domain-containing protein YqiC
MCQCSKGFSINGLLEMSAGDPNSRAGPVHDAGASHRGAARDWGSAAFLARLGRIDRPAVGASGAPAMLNTKPFDEIAARIGKAIESSPAKDIEKNVKAMLASSLARLDLVPRAEFELQANVLAKTREKLDALERRLAEIEARFTPPAP